MSRRERENTRYSERGGCHAAAASESESKRKEIIVDYMRASKPKMVLTVDKARGSNHGLIASLASEGVSLSKLGAARFEVSVIVITAACRHGVRERRRGDMDFSRKISGF